MIDDEVEQIFSDQSGCHSNIPDAIWGGKGSEFMIDYSYAHAGQAKAYCEAWCEQFIEETGIKLEYDYETYVSPKYYNFESDRAFVYMTDASIKALYKASRLNKHVKLGERIKREFTSRDGFISGYSNDVNEWIVKPVMEWDHNELGTLLLAVLEITSPDWDDDYHFETYTLMEDYQYNGHLSNDVWEGIPSRMREFIDAQREFIEEYDEFMDFELWVETGESYNFGTKREELEEAKKFPPKPCKFTLDLFRKNP